MDVVERLEWHSSMMDDTTGNSPYDLMREAADVIRNLRAELARMKQERDYEC